MRYVRERPPPKIVGLQTRRGAAMKKAMEENVGAQKPTARGLLIQKTMEEYAKAAALRALQARRLPPDEEKSRNQAIEHFLLLRTHLLALFDLGTRRYLGR